MTIIIDGMNIVWVTIKNPKPGDSIYILEEQYHMLPFP